jgi:pyrimidine operon attenuation protein / uracil phosphoribosyltransferase
VTDETAPRRPARGAAPTALLTDDDVTRALRRIAHEVLERNHDAPLAVVGLQRGGVPLAQRLYETLVEIGAPDVARGELDVAFFRDDLAARPVTGPGATALPPRLEDRVVVLVDDVLFTGRTVRAALNALHEWGRPRSIQLAVLVDRGHRELPIRPDFVGKNVPTSRDETVRATLDGVWLERR